MAKDKKTRLHHVEAAIHDRVDKLMQLLQEEPAGPAYIHAIRVHIKHLRAWLRLQRIKPDGQNWKVMDRALRAYARALGQARDSQVVSEQLQAFSRRAASADEIYAIKRVVRNCKLDMKEASIDWSDLKKTLPADLAIYEECYVQIASIKSLRKDLKRQYKRTVHTAVRAYAEGRSFEVLHRFRKNVKALNYQLGFINKGLSNRARSMKKRLASLGESLGDIHDIDIIQHYINGLPARRLYRSERQALARVLERELTILLDESHALSNHTFKQGPADFVAFLKK